MGSALALSKKKIALEREPFRTLRKSSVIWDVQLYGASSQEGLKNTLTYLKPHSARF